LFVLQNHSLALLHFKWRPNFFAVMWLNIFWKSGDTISFIFIFPEYFAFFVLRLLIS
jgi:hypothetical protein